MAGLQFDETFDFVSVGSGGGSMVAALVIRAMGKSVAVLEKMPRIGGTTSRSGGVMWIPNSHFMKDCDEQHRLRADGGDSVPADPSFLQAKTSEIVDGLEGAKISFLNLVQRLKADQAPAR